MKYPVLVVSVRTRAFARWRYRNVASSAHTPDFRASAKVIEARTLAQKQGDRQDAELLDKEFSTATARSRWAYFLPNDSAQFSITTIGGALFSPAVVDTRKRLPSPVTA